jgi:hypothetical protein
MSEQEPGVEDSGHVVRGPSAAPEPSWWAQTPRWVPVFAVVAVIVSALVVVMLVAGHGPGQHMNHGMRAIGPAGW